MRNTRQVKVINSQLEVLEELKEQLHNVITYIDNVLQKGMSWVKEEESTSFKEINHFLTNETSECFQRCLNLGNGNEELSRPCSTSEEDKGISSISMSSSSACSTEKNQWSGKVIAKQSKTLKAMKQKFKETAEKIQQMKGDMERKNDLKFKEIMTELQAASNFMSELQIQNELLTNKMNENLKQHTELVEKKLNSFVKENVSNDDPAHTVEFAQVNKRVSENCDEIKEIKNQSGSMFTSLKEVEGRLEEVSILVDRLKTSCQGYAEKEDLNIKIRNVATKVDEMLQRISTNESTDLAICFDACAEEFNIYCHDNDILTCFTQVIEDLGKNFNTDTGIYTIPKDGIYLCALFIEIETFVKKEMCFDLFLKPSKDENVEQDEEEFVIASCHAKFRFQTACDVSFRKLKLGDQLYVRFIAKEQNVRFNNHSHFTCVFLNPC